MSLLNFVVLSVSLQGTAGSFSRPGGFPGEDEQKGEFTAANYLILKLLFYQ